MRVLIIGATGNSGLALTRMALARGLAVTALVRNPVRLRDQLGGEAAAAANLAIRTGLLADHAALASAMQGQDVVINAAGNATVDADFVPMLQGVITVAEQVLGPGGRLWLFGGAAALDVPGHDRRAADLPFIPAVYKQHLHTLARLRRSGLDWSLLCPGPMLSAADGAPTPGLRISAETWPVAGPGPSRLLHTLRILRAFRARLPEMIVSHEDAASVILDHLPPGGRFARQRVGLALPVGQIGTKAGLS